MPAAKIQCEPVTLSFIQFTHSLIHSFIDHAQCTTHKHVYNELTIKAAR